jgi:diguanylate cyclase (GGDEF)-like protein
MATDEKLAEILSEFARTMVTDFPIQDILDHLVTRIVDLMPVTGAGVTLVSVGQGPSHVAASSESSGTYERLQTELGEGPCVESCLRGKAVSAPDLRLEDRFPAFTRAALDKGLAAVFAFPLLHDGIQLGALDLYRDTPGPLDASSLKTAKTLADVAASYLINATTRADLIRSLDVARQNYPQDPLTGLAKLQLAWSAIESHHPGLVDAPADIRSGAAEARDAAADAADDMARERDDHAEARDRRADARTVNRSVDVDCRSDRAAAKQDRQESATDRTRALHDRVAAGTDRIFASRELAQSLVDELTGAHRRSAGLLELEREADRAQRTHTTYSIAFIDVDGLKRVNDTLGHAAGDSLLVNVVQALRLRVRPYDLVVRFGGDEFLCGLPNMELVEARQRIALVNGDLRAQGTSHITAGLARLESDETLADLIRRADEDLYRRREAKRRERHVAG